MNNKSGYFLISLNIASSPGRLNVVPRTPYRRLCFYLCVYGCVNRLHRKEKNRQNKW